MPEHHRDDEGAKLGMWLFLFTEILLFGGLFVLYAVYLQRYQPDFHLASAELDVRMGALNTVVLITSSAFVAWGIAALKRGNVKVATRMTVLTIAFAAVFLVVKYFEWGAKFHHGLYPGGAELDARAQGQMVYFALYYLMTGLHGVHIVVGMGVLSWVLWLVNTGHVTPERYVALENAGLYWHLVDLIWIYLFPLFYLIT
ncbi:cytochrome c oxidase subunit 3 family protein [Desulfovibrio ferrophilus]|uniref:Cytochrome c oxidase subunit III n=1 Tax=Desulfovibrio ferrophilus TaxID=241368 RepID=A0A2Z6AU91_9BACT|nr:cytochrome c oxidase subunit 3 family protein [Desulfovibrio ferrophilus]BBD06793.1 cytochrome c oxidase subunit III [Desulfovibrio ferrophilus]